MICQVIQASRMPNARLLAALQALTRVCAGGEVWKRSLLALLPIRLRRSNVCRSIPLRACVGALTDWF